MSECTSPNFLFFIDVYWTELQSNYKWFGINPSLGHQKLNDYSDIEGGIVNYLSLFKYEQPPKKDKIILKIINNEMIKYEENITPENNIFFYVIENKLLEKDFIINEYKKIIEIKSLNNIYNCMKLLFNDIEHIENIENI